MRPDWNNKRALVEYVVQLIADLGQHIDVPATGSTDAVAIALVAARRQAVLVKYGLTKSPFESATRFSSWVELESELVPIAESGNYPPLFRLLVFPDARAAFKESTWRLISEIGTGRHKRPAHASRQTDAERFNRYRVHQAAYLIPVTMRMLRVWYPAQKDHAIKKRAIEIVANIYQIRDSTLIEHMRRPTEGRRRRRFPG
jgi:hypothetical protein